MNTFNDVISLNSGGSEFQSFGAAMVKDLSPYDAVLLLGLTNVIAWFCDRNALFG